MTQKSPEESTDIIAEAKVLYDAKIRAQVETAENVGKIVLLDVNSGDYRLVSDERGQRLKVNQEMLAAKPDARILAFRVGFKPVFVQRNPNRWVATAKRKQEAIK